MISSDNTLFALPKYEIIFLLFVGTSSSTSSKRNIFYTSLHEYRLFLRVSFTSIFLPRLTVRSIEGLQEAFATGHNTCICRCSEVACNEFIDWVSSRKRDGLLCYEKGKKSPDQISTNPSAFNQGIFPNESMICGPKPPVCLSPSKTKASMTLKKHVGNLTDSKKGVNSAVFLCLCPYKICWCLLIFTDDERTIRMMDIVDE